MTIAEQLIEKGKVEGELQAIRKLAENAFCEKLHLVTIQKLTGLTLEELQRIQNICSRTTSISTK